VSRTDATADLVLEVRRRGDTDAVHTWTLEGFTDVSTDTVDVSAFPTRTETNGCC